VHDDRGESCEGRLFMDTRKHRRNAAPADHLRRQGEPERDRYRHEEEGNHS
jgi:hypothetical protein